MAEKILTTEYSEEMQRSYLNYSMSVITARAIPDARDGLKPVSYTHLERRGEVLRNSAPTYGNRRCRILKPDRGVLAGKY